MLEPTKKKRTRLILSDLLSMDLVDTPADPNALIHVTKRDANSVVIPNATAPMQALLDGLINKATGSEMTNVSQNSSLARSNDPQAGENTTNSRATITENLHNAARAHGWNGTDPLTAFLRTVLPTIGIGEPIRPLMHEYGEPLQSMANSVPYAPPIERTPSKATEVIVEQRGPTEAERQAASADLERRTKEMNESIAAAKSARRATGRLTQRISKASQRGIDQLEDTLAKHEQSIRADAAERYQSVRPRGVMADVHDQIINKCCLLYPAEFAGVGPETRLTSGQTALYAKMAKAK